MPQGLPLSLRPRCRRHVLVMNPDPRYWHGDTEKSKPTAKQFCLNQKDAFDANSPNLYCTGGATPHWFRQATRKSKGFTVTISSDYLGRVALIDSQYPNAPRTNQTTNNSNSSGDGTGAAIALGLGALLLFGLGAEANRKADQDKCMRSCRESRSRCVQLCTQR